MSQLFYYYMTQNTTFQTLIPSFCLGFPLFYPINFENFHEEPTCQMEKIQINHFYPTWSTDFQFEENKETFAPKSDDNQAIDQTSSGSRSFEIIQKSKRVQAPRFRPTKNNESNISNQTFSFVTNENKSRISLQNFFKNKRKTEVFYEYTKNLISKRKKYMSKGTLLKLCKLTQFLEEFDGLKKVKVSSILSLKEFQSGVRFLILYFLKHKSASSILTSQKIAGNLKKDHINKVRQIVDYIQQNLQTASKLDEKNEDDIQIKIEC